jgi:cytochrome-b5 reductase
MNNAADADEERDTGLSSKQFNPLVLGEVIPYNHNTKIFVFQLKDVEAPLNMPCASFLLARADIDGKTVVRPYTPLRSDSIGTVALLVKEYPDGKMSSHIHNLQPGDTLDIKGPLPKIEYKPNMKKHLSMIAGGTGITPMLQVIQRVLVNPHDNTNITLVFGNQSPEDVLLYDFLNMLAQNFDNFKVHYTVDKPDETWTGLSGYVDHAKLKELIPPPSDDHLVFVCGPGPMVKSVSGSKAKDYSQGELDGALKDMGFVKDQVYKF